MNHSILNIVFNKTIIVCFILLLLVSNIYGRPIWVSLFNSQQVRSVVISAYNGQLTVSSDDGTQFVITAGQAVYASLTDGKIRISGVNGHVGSFESVIVQGADSSAIIRLRPVSPQIGARNYEGMVSLSADVDRIQLINRIDEEHYIAGVIEAEVGQGQASEFYKAKSVICRTYLYGNIDRHENEGFHLCDEVHCQAFKGQCRNHNILTAVTAAKGVILTDREDSKPILAAYHANCGGETESAHNAWQNDLPFLIPVTDPHCAHTNNANWQKSISLDDWISYLMKNGLKLDPALVTDFSFQQVHRVPDYTVNDFTIPVRKIRNDWQLRSSFFSIVVEDENVVLQGRGYGHGVGLCQEGAMEMGRQGFKYDDMISFYYKYVNLVAVSELQIRIPEFDQ